MASSGTHGHGTTLSGSSLGTVGEVIDIDLGGIEATDIDLGSMDSTDKYKDFISGMIDAGEISFNCIYDKTQASSLYGAVGTSDTFTVTFPDSATFVASGYVKNVGTTIPFEDKIEQSVTIKISGKPTFSVS